jgi:hypothetical protein
VAYLVRVRNGSFADNKCLNRFILGKEEMSYVVW